MPLQIRRGPTADRLAITPLVGELVYDTDTGTVYVGDGTTPGGVAATNFTEADARQATARVFLGTGLNDNTVHSGISFTLVGDRLHAAISDTFEGDFKGSLFAEDSGILVDAENHIFYGSLVGSVFSEDSTGPLVDAQDGSINLNGTVKGHIVPDRDIVYDLGSNSNRFRDLYLSGSSINLGGAVISSPDGISIDLPSTSTIGGSPVIVASGIPQEIDINGSVFADDSTGPLVDGTNASINLDGTIKGDAIPDTTETRNLGSFARKFNKLYLTESADSLYIGNAAIGSVGAVIDLPAGSTVGGSPIGAGSGVTPGASYNINILADDASNIVNATTKTFTGNLIGNVTGTVTGSLDGTVTQASQPNITEVGTLSFLTVTGAATIGGNLSADKIFSDDFTGSLYGSVYALNSTLLVDGFNGFIPAQNVQGTFTGDVVGNIKGSVFSDDSSKIVDGVESKIYAPGGVYADLKNDNEDLVLSVSTKSAVLNEVTAGTFFIGNAGAIVNPSGTTMLINVGNTAFAKDSVDPTTPLVSILTADSSNTDANSFVVTRQRGTLISPSSVLVGDEFGNFEYSGFDGTGYQLTGGFKGIVDGAVSTGVIPSRIEIFVNDANGIEVTPIKVKSTEVEFTLPPKLPVVANDSDRFDLVPNPVAGMLIFMVAGTTPAATNVVQVFDGTNWVNLH